MTTVDQGGTAGFCTGNWTTLHELSCSTCAQIIRLDSMSFWRKLITNPKKEDNHQVIQTCVTVSQFSLIYNIRPCWTTCRSWFRTRPTTMLKSPTISRSTSPTSRPGRSSLETLVLHVNRSWAHCRMLRSSREEEDRLIDNTWRSLWLFRSFICKNITVHKDN